ncbi:PEP-CTERM sorting domain-containing protein [Candidatus Nitronereus thalassa]|uniref:PEP-CTERM sorting domain-containing protein n=1 Tax=Candidatus Nitronereus thalassa TaxID=3020898 RepID=A0ABU3K826_9BACT|nr:PEP-CTERM sorting domain-containing protein [Candidatus Nitronereus thalassa]MDT7042551.1 PEP-CTERM sorting domain-containing protein [Candidatus Nitronereus thalassa]
MNHSIGMKSRSFFVLSVLTMMAFVGFSSVNPAHATPINLGTSDVDWTSSQTSTHTDAEISGITGILNLTQVYKQNQGGSESGSSASHYTTTFPNGAEDAQITWNGPGFLECAVLECVILAKNGNHSPQQQLFNVGVSGIGWDGKMQINLEDLWPNQGSFSHVAIYTAPGTGGQVPEPSTMLLLGSGLVGLIGYRIKKAWV